MIRRQEKPFRMGLTATGLSEPKWTSHPTERVHSSIAGSSPHRGCLCRLGGGTWHRGCGAQAKAASPAEPTMDSCRDRNASAMPTLLQTLVGLDTGQNLSFPSLPPQIMKFSAFIIYFACCAYLQVYTVLLLE